MSRDGILFIMVASNEVVIILVLMDDKRFVIDYVQMLHVITLLLLSLFELLLTNAKVARKSVFRGL